MITNWSNGEIYLFPHFRKIFGHFRTHVEGCSQYRTNRRLVYNNGMIISGHSGRTNRSPAMGSWHVTIYGHALVLKAITNIPDNINFSRSLIRREIHCKVFRRITHREGYEWYHYRFDLILKIWLEVFIITEHGRNISFKLSDYCNIYQAKISAFWKAIRWLLYCRIFNVNIRICTGSKQKAFECLINDIRHWRHS